MSAVGMAVVPDHFPELSDVSCPQSFSRAVGRRLSPITFQCVGTGDDGNA